jgi:hypothetical protein
MAGWWEEGLCRRLADRGRFMIRYGGLTMGAVE